MRLIFHDEIQKHSNFSLNLFDSTINLLSISFSLSVLVFMGIITFIKHFLIALLNIMAILSFFLFMALSLDSGE
jgi:hypothetical protein